jgi:hypothetical protein
MEQKKEIGVGGTGNIVSNYFSCWLLKNHSECFILIKVFICMSPDIVGIAIRNKY